MTFYHPNLSICLVLPQIVLARQIAKLNCFPSLFPIITTIAQYALNSITSYSVFLQFLLSLTKNTLTCFTLHFETKELSAFLV